MDDLGEHMEVEDDGNDTQRAIPKIIIRTKRQLKSEGGVYSELTYIKPFNIKGIRTKQSSLKGFIAISVKKLAKSRVNIVNIDYLLAGRKTYTLPSMPDPAQPEIPEEPEDPEMTIPETIDDPHGNGTGDVTETSKPKKKKRKKTTR